MNNFSIDDIFSDIEINEDTIRPYDFPDQKTLFLRVKSHLVPLMYFWDLGWESHGLLTLGDPLYNLDFIIK